MRCRTQKRITFLIFIVSVQSVLIALFIIKDSAQDAPFPQQIADLKNKRLSIENIPGVQDDSRHRLSVTIAHIRSKNTNHEKNDQVTKHHESHNVPREKIFKKRTDLLSEQCKLYTTSQRCFWHAYGRTIVDEAHKTLFCEIFKVGSSNWMRTFLGFVADVTPNFRKRIDSYYKHLSSSMWSKPGERAAMVRDYTTRFMFVRHPFSRLVSCFADKVDHDPDVDFIERHLKLIEAETGTRPAKLTFSNFVDYIIQVSVSEEGVDNLDQHIKPMYRTCCPCEVRYDYIGHLETQQEDSNFILKKMGVNVTFPRSDPIATNSSNSGKITHYFSQLNHKQIYGLYQLFMWDFKLFGYEFPEYLKSPDIPI
ncbi:carbohydrate sulfotransferase 11-like isoform X1 [Ptychodera flava]|uniref:carbohydrate sulfotransferase 11-like isoform X1 n=1 Tax=Ptychodera flava TaxID=63121 RepID=UPI00396A09D8